MVQWGGREGYVAAAGHPTVTGGYYSQLAGYRQELRTGVGVKQAAANGRKVGGR